ncbi:MAG: hypothetical protein R3255_07810 [Candidatus Lokiarchaeia archaeon]|nr:hypothetical protein [Candidatus Lokiarchaeia archaeon]
MEYLDRNYKIVEKRMTEQMETSLNYGRELIDSEIDAGSLNFVIKPIVKSFYKYWSDKDAKVGTLAQIRITLDSAKEFLKDGDGSKEQLNKIINRNFPIYLKNDQTYIQCKETHRNYKKLEEVTKKCFITQVEETILFFNVKNDLKDYNELSRLAFKTKEKAYEALKRQLDYNDEGISIVEKDDSILKVPLGKNIILKVLRMGFEMTKEKLIEELDTIFN